jgi:hypothetical protein
MTREALETYRQAHDQQLLRNEARHIRTRVHEARQSTHLAGMRWPFELLQNALDAGPRAGRDAVKILLRQLRDRVVFEHDGAPFTSQELAALLSGGSSKEFGSDDTTGRFGTGFLVTHVLAERTSVEGLLAVGSAYELFQLELDRGGDEDEILANIESCNAAIAAAQPLASVEEMPSAQFEYLIDDAGSLELGVEAFRSALPYLFGTRPRLGEVRLETGDDTVEVWTPAESSQEDGLQDGVVSKRMIQVDGEDRHELCIVRVGQAASTTAALFLLERGTDECWEVSLPGLELPRVYRQYPLRDSVFLPVDIVLDGDFEPDQERSRVLMGAADRQAMSDALGTAVLAVSYAVDQGWKNAHLLARAAEPNSGFDPSDAGELQWWRSELKSFAERLARLPIVETTNGMLPAQSDAAEADFIAARLLDDPGPEETSVERMWALTAGTTELCPPTRDLADDWSVIADGWDALGLRLNRITVESLAKHARGDARTVDELSVQGDPYEWLAMFLDVVGECWERRRGMEASVLTELIPNQNGYLRSPGSLRRDLGVPEELKMICADVGLDIRAGLLSNQLADAISERAPRFGASTLSKAITRSVEPPDVVTELLDHLSAELPEGAECSEANAKGQRGTVRLLDYLWTTGGRGAASAAQTVPLVAASKKVVRWSSTRVMMAPVGAWGETARPFKAAYPEERVLDDIYVGLESVVPALVEWGVAIKDPISRSTPPELDGPRLANMVEPGFDSSGVTVRGEEFSEIALLSREVVNHIQDHEQATALLGLVLCHVARHDRGWRQQSVVKGTKDRVAIEVPLRGALWIGDLRSRAWVPVPGEDDKPAKVTASVATLRPLLEPSWLEGNSDAIELLTECFGFDELDLRLLGIPEEVQGRVRQALAGILETGGTDPAFYESLAREAEAKQRRDRDVNRFRRMGLAVQEAVRQALESHGLQVELVDYGFDYAVSLTAADESLEDLAIGFGVGPYLVEVKATAAGPVRLTPTQAETATGRSAQYVLCVADLRGLADERLDGEWTGADVEPLISMLSDIGDRVGGTCGLVRQARDRPVGIRNERALRYEVQVETWIGGRSISDWVASIKGDIGAGSGLA